MNATMTRNTDAIQAGKRAQEQRIRAFKKAPGHYRVPAFTTRGIRPARWFDVRVLKLVSAARGPRFQVICDHPQVMSYVDRRDDYGNSTCKHAAAVVRRLLRLEDEQAEVPTSHVQQSPSNPFEGL